MSHLELRVVDVDTGDLEAVHSASPGVGEGLCVHVQRGDLRTVDPPEGCRVVGSVEMELQGHHDPTVRLLELSAHGPKVLHRVTSVVP